VRQSTSPVLEAAIHVVTAVDDGGVVGHFVKPGAQTAGHDSTEASFLCRASAPGVCTNQVPLVLPLCFQADRRRVQEDQANQDKEYF